MVSRLDRRVGYEKSGGIALFVHDSLVARLVHVSDSGQSERSWHVFHTDIGPILFGLWYRPPGYGEIQKMIGLETELKAWAPCVIGSVIIGDMNVHHKPWLQHSNGIAPEGIALFRMCSRNSIEQLIKHLLEISIYWIWFFLTLVSY